MRLPTLILLVAVMGVAYVASARAQWTDVKIPGEQHLTTQSCAGETRNPGDWVCIFVRCDQPGSPPSLYFSTSGPDIQGSIKVVIDDKSFALSVPSFAQIAAPAVDACRSRSRRSHRSDEGGKHALH